MCGQGEGREGNTPAGTLFSQRAEHGECFDDSSAAEPTPAPPTSATHPMHLWGGGPGSPPALLSSPHIAQQPGARALCAGGAVLVRLPGRRLGTPTSWGSCPTQQLPVPLSSRAAMPPVELLSQTYQCWPQNGPYWVAPS